VVVFEVFGSGPSTSTPVVQLLEVLSGVWVLISDGMFYGTSGVLTSVVTHYPDLDFVTICRGYTDGCSADKIHAMGESLVPHAQMVTEKVGDGGSPFDHGRRHASGRCRPACGGSRGRVGGERHPTPNQAERHPDHNQTEQLSSQPQPSYLRPRQLYH